jgi:hypothetical protein
MFWCKHDKVLNTPNSFYNYKRIIVIFQLLKKIKANNEFKKSQNEILEKYKDDPATQQRLIKEAREFANREIEGAESDRAAKTKEINDKKAEERKKERDQAAKEKTEKLLNNNSSVFVWPENISCKDFNELAIFLKQDSISHKFILNYTK